MSLHEHLSQHVYKECMPLKCTMSTPYISNMIKEPFQVQNQCATEDMYHSLGSMRTGLRS